MIRELRPAMAESHRLKRTIRANAVGCPKSICHQGSFSLSVWNPHLPSMTPSVAPRASCSGVTFPARWAVGPLRSSSCFSQAASICSGVVAGEGTSATVVETASSQHRGNTRPCLKTRTMALRGRRHEEIQPFRRPRSAIVQRNRDAFIEQLLFGFLLFPYIAQFGGNLAANAVINENIFHRIEDLSTVEHE